MDQKGKYVCFPLLLRFVDFFFTLIMLLVSTSVHVFENVAVHPGVYIYVVPQSM